MRKVRKLRQLENRRERTLNVCLPHVIKDRKEVEDLFVGDFHVKLPRQTSRSCHVVFANTEEKIKNQKLAKNKTIDGKHIVVLPLRKIVVTEKKIAKKKTKKIVMPKITPEVKVTQTIFVSNLELSTKIDEVRGALAGCISVIMLKPYNKKFRGAIAKMENIHVAAEYLKGERKWPTIRGHKVSLKPDIRTKHKRKAKAPTGTLKIYDDEVPAKEKCESNERHDSSKCSASDES